MSYTRAPWHWHGEKAGFTLAGKGGTVLVCYIRPGPEDRALIKAAPDLLAACEAIVTAERDFWRQTGIAKPSNMDPLSKAITQARAVIAAAKGE